MPGEGVGWSPDSMTARPANQQLSLILPANQQLPLIWDYTMPANQLLSLSHNPLFHLSSILKSEKGVGPVMDGEAQA